MSETNNNVNRDSTITGSIAKLAIGESLAFAERLDGDALDKELITSTTKRLANIASKPVQRVSQQTGAEYKVERIESFTRSHDVVCVVVVTRVG